MTRRALSAVIGCVFGVNAQEVPSELAALHGKTQRLRDSVLELRKKEQESLPEHATPAEKRASYLREDALFNVSDANDVEEMRLDIAYTKAHPECLPCAKDVLWKMSLQRSMAFYDDFESIYKATSDSFKNTEEGKEIAEKLHRFKISRPGFPAPFFSGKDVDRKPIALSDFKGKYVLIDFWASWCAPCRGEMPDLKRLYAGYHDKGLEIISVTHDDQRVPDAWRKAIEKEGIGMWKHFSDDENASDVKKLYFVTGIPHKILIDPNGIIIGKWKGSGELNRTQLERQLAVIFD